MKGKCRHDMPTASICQLENSLARDNNYRYFFLLLVCVLIFGSSKADAVPRIGDQNLYAVNGVNQKKREITLKTTQIPTLTNTLNISPGARRRHQTLQRQVGPLNKSQDSLDPSMLRPLYNQRIFGVAATDNSAAPTRRILSSEELPEMEDARSHEHEREFGHVPEHAPEHVHEGGTIDTVDEAGEEEEEEEDEEEENEEKESEEEESEEEDERGDYGHSEDVGENASMQSERTPFGSVSQAYHTIKPKLQSMEGIHSKLQAAAKEASGMKSSKDTAREDSSYKVQSEQTPRNENSDKDSKAGSKNGGGFRGVPGGSMDGANITQISYMIYKIVKKYHIKSVLDIPCRNNLNWFPELLHHIDFEVIGFRYICVDEGAEGDEKLHAHFSESGSPEFLSIPPTESYELPRSDLVFSYDGPQQWGVRKTWAFFTGLRKVRPKYIIVTNNPGQMNDDVEHTLNLRKQPFHFSQAMRVISNVATSGRPKQLVFYETEDIREGF